MSRNEVEKPLPNTSMFSTPLELTQSSNLTFNSHYILPDTGNKPSTLNLNTETLYLLPDTTDSILKTTFYSQIRHFERNEEIATNRVEKPHSEPRSSRQAPRLNTSGHGALTETLNLKPETLNSLPDTTDSRLKTQDSRLNLELSTSLITGSGFNLPFHLHTNRLGTVDPNSTNFLNRIKLSGDLMEWNGLSLDYGSDLALRVSENSTAFFSELYLGSEYGAFRLDAGRFDRPIGLNNHDLSIGSMMVSRNTVPIQRIMISNPEFTDMPWTNGIVQFKGMYSHGWFTDDRYTDSPYLHQKYLYLKVNAGKFSAIGGIVHNAFWGGKSPELGYLPESIDDYLRIVIPQKADSSSSASQSEIKNRLGNHIGAYETALSYNNENFRLTLTRLFYLEDTVSMAFRSPWDGVWGINFFNKSNKFPKELTYEFIYTKRQDSRSDEEWGRSKYYRHNVYRSGWTNFGRVIGIPLINKSSESDILIDNNIIVGHHISFLSEFLNTQLLFSATYSRNYGVGLWKVPKNTINWSERRKDQYSILLKFTRSVEIFPNFKYSLSLSSDRGQLYNQALGIKLTLEIEI